MKCNKRILFFIFSFIFSSSGIFAQVCVDIEIPTYAVIKGGTMDLRIQAYNMPDGAVLKVRANKENIPAEGNTAHIMYSDTMVGTYLLEVSWFQGSTTQNASFAITR